MVAVRSASRVDDDAHRIESTPHVLGPVGARVNEILEADGHPPIAHLTRHTLRRTFASILGVCRVDTRRAVALLGHTDARVMMGVYAQLLKLGDGNVELLETLMSCTRDEARAIFESERVLRTNSERAAKRLPHPAAAR